MKFGDVDASGSFSDRDSEAQVACVVFLCRVPHSPHLLLLSSVARFHGVRFGVDESMRRLI